MQHPPVIKDQHIPRLQLLPVLILLLLEQRIKLTSSIVPLLHVLDRQLDTRAVRTIPAHAQQVPGSGVVFEDGEAAVGLDADAFVARGVGVDVYGRKDPVCFSICFQQLVRDFEAVDEEGRAAFAVGVREQVECLQACGVGEVGIVGVGFECNVGVCGVLGREVRCELVEAAVVRVAEEGDAFEEGFRVAGFAVVGGVDEAEAIFALGVEF
jgi:hypothetical protein